MRITRGNPAAYPQRIPTESAPLSGFISAPHNHPWTPTVAVSVQQFAAGVCLPAVCVCGGGDDDNNYGDEVWSMSHEGSESGAELLLWHSSQAAGAANYQLSHVSPGNQEPGRNILIRQCNLLFSICNSIVNDTWHVIPRNFTCQWLCHSQSRAEKRLCECLYSFLGGFERRRADLDGSTFQKATFLTSKCSVRSIQCLYSAVTCQCPWIMSLMLPNPHPSSVLMSRFHHEIPQEEILVTFLYLATIPGKKRVV